MTSPINELVERLPRQAATLEKHSHERHLWPGDNDFEDAARSMREAADALVALQAERDAVLEGAAKVCEAEANAFLSPQYASNQPLGSLTERFACAECAKAIRSLKGALPNPRSP